MGGRDKRHRVLSIVLGITLVLGLVGLFGLVAPSPALAAGGSLTIEGPGLNIQDPDGDGTPGVTITQNQLRGTQALPPALQQLTGWTYLPQHDEWYSTINTWPTKNFYRGKGVKLVDLLRLAGGLNEQATLIKFIASDGFAATFTVRELVYEPRYRYPNFMYDEHGNWSQAGHIIGDASGAVPVEPMIAWKSGSSPYPEDLSDEENLSTADANHLLYGQRAVTQQTNARFAKYTTTIQVLTDPVEKWGNPTADPPPGEVPAGTKVELHSPYDDEDKVHYTLDGSDPTIHSPMYNWIASRWWSSREDVLDEINKPIEITQDTTIKAFVTGPGRDDSDIVTFEYTIATVAVTGVSIAQGDQAELGVGQTLQLTAVVEPENATNKNVTWSSSDENVATVDQNGLVTAVSAGTATITVTTEDGGYTDSISVTVVEAQPYIVSITEVHDVQVPYGTSEADAIAALASETTIVDSEGASHTVTLNWTIAGYDGNTPGDYTATGTFELPAGVKQSDPPMDLKVTATVTVLPQPMYPVTLAVEPAGGGTVTGAGEYPAGASVTVEAQAAEGYTFVNWTDAEGKEVSAAASYTFTMGTQPVTLTANFSLLEASQYAFRYELPAEIVEGQDVEVAVTFESVEVKHLGYDGVRFKFSAAGPGDVTFTAEDSNGVVHTFTNEGYWGPAGGFDLPKEYSATTPWTLNFAQAGTYTVTFSLIDADSEAVIAGLTESITVTVVPATVPVTGVSIAEGDQELGVGETVQLTAVVEPENATNKNVTWSSSNEAVATVSETGLVTAVSPGEAAITVTTEDGGFTDSITLTVVPATYTVTFVVTDGEGAVEGATIEIRDAGGNVIAAELDGTYKLVAGTYRYTVTKEGFKQAAGTFTVEDDALTVEVTLEPEVVEPERPKYDVSPAEDDIYTIGETQDGIKTMTVNAGVTGFKYFTVSIEPVVPHDGSETVVFTHSRSGSQLGLNAARPAFRTC